MKNHGADDAVNAMFDMGIEMMALPLEEKMKYEQGDDGEREWKLKRERERERERGGHGQERELHFKYLEPVGQRVWQQPTSRAPTCLDHTQGRADVGGR